MYLATSEFSGWSDLSPSTVDRIAKNLRDRGLWKSECQALRALNKHWCRCLNCHVTRVRPGDNRRITPADVQSLLKFPNLESIDISLFVFAGCPCDRSLQVKFGQWYEADVSKQKRGLVSVLEAATKVPKLKELIVDENLDVIDPSVWVEDDVLSMLAQLKESSVEFFWSHYGGSRFERDSDDPSYTEEPNPSSFPGVLKLCPSFAKVTKLDLRGRYLFCSSEECRLLKSFGKCKKYLSIHAHPDNLDIIAEIENVESLHLLMSSPANLTPLTKMTSLRQASICGWFHMTTSMTYEESQRHTDVILDEIGFLSETLRLTAVQIGFVTETQQRNHRFINGLATVRCLQVFYSPQMYRQIAACITELEFLDISFLNHQAEELLSYIDRPDTVEGRCLINLKGLKLSCGRIIFGGQDHSPICKMRNLKVLVLQEMAILSLPDFSSLNELTNLRYLGIGGPCQGLELDLHKFEAISHLETVNIALDDPSDRDYLAIKAMEDSRLNVSVSPRRAHFYDLYKKYGSGIE